MDLQCSLPGASYGGLGGIGLNIGPLSRICTLGYIPPYGSDSDVVYEGSGSVTFKSNLMLGGSGGGLIQITAVRTLTNNGLVVASGSNNPDGTYSGSSGGAIGVQT